MASRMALWKVGWHDRSGAWHWTKVRAMTKQSAMNKIKRPGRIVISARLIG